MKFRLLTSTGILAQQINQELHCLIFHQNQSMYIKEFFFTKTIFYTHTHMQAHNTN